jgi:hypothetical protein
MKGHSTELRGAAPGLVADWRRIAAFAVALAGSALLLFFFHDRFWWGPDEGAYAHVAERILQGDVLNRDVQDMHAGYINFANALAFRLFGLDLVSLRYPIVLMGIAQALLVFSLLEPRGRIAAVVASLALTAHSFVQFPNPTANWYGLFLAIVVLWMLARTDMKQRLALETVGFLLVTTFLFRQLTGVVVAMGAVAWLLTTLPPSALPGRPWLGRIVLGVMAAGLGAFLVSKTDIAGGLLFGLWPLLFLVLAAHASRADDRAVLGLIGRLSVGGAVALLPLLAYHLAHGSLLTWLDDIVGGALALNAMPFTGRLLHAAMIFLSGKQLLAFDSVAAVVNGLYWLAVLALPAVNGVLLLRNLRNPEAPRDPILTFAVFHALVSVFHQIPVYLMFSTGLSLAAFIGAMCPRGRQQSLTAIGLACFAAAVALHYHAAQPATRYVSESVAGLRIPALVDSALPRVSLRIEPEDAAAHRRIVALVAREVPADGAILAVPFEPQLYYLSQRRNPVRFYNTAIGLRDEAAVAATLAILERDPPALLFFRPNDKYNTTLSRALMERLKPSYALIDEIGGLEVYRRR